MAEIIALCGKICVGKSHYAKELAGKECAVILSCDEITLGILGGNLGKQHDEICTRVQAYLMRKAVQIVRAGSNVILDFGFWSRASRDDARRFFVEARTALRWHYIHTDDRTWRENIARRNRAITAGAGNDYFVDEGLAEKCIRLFEPPTPDETMVSIDLSR